MKRKRDIEAFSLSFLDCICCGFGAIILLLVLSKIYDPVVIEESPEDLAALIAKLQEELFEIRGQEVVLNRELESAREQRSDSKISLAKLQGELNKVRGQYELTMKNSAESLVDEGDLQAARQRLNAEVQRLQPYYRRADEDAVGGIPVDSEYIIFVIDTSGSMQQYNWDRVQQKLNETLDAYPQVKGMQIMNDNGQYMFQQYNGKWIPDSPGRRAIISKTMRNWKPFSDSNPVDGIIYAINEFYSPEKKISIYVFGDDFSGRSVEQVIRTINGINRPDANGDRMVRIHGIGFPMGFRGRGTVPESVKRFAALMRAICENNGGTFVALTDYDR